jgi:hypothetical protein
MHVNKIIESDYLQVSIKHILTSFCPSYSFFLAAMCAINPQFEIKSNPS